MMRNLLLATLFLTTSVSYAGSFAYKMKWHSSTANPAMPGGANAACKGAVDEAKAALQKKCTSIQGTSTQVEVELDPNDGQYSTCAATVTLTCIASLD